MIKMPSIYRIATLATCSFLLFTFWLIYTANTGGNSVFFNMSYSIAYGDKIGHFIIFSSLTLLLNVALKFKTIEFKQRTILLGTISIIGFALIEEMSQALIPSREFDFKDLGSDAIGIYLAHYLSNKLKYMLDKNKLILKRR